MTAATTASHIRKPPALLILAVLIAVFLFVFFGWNAASSLYEQSAIFVALFLGSLGLLSLLFSSSKPIKLIGIVVLIGFLFFVFAPVSASPDGTFQTCGGPEGCVSHTQYTSLSYIYLGTGAVYQTPDRYWVGQEVYF
ncbi:MAG: hypothetical protein ABSG45_00035 [Nitrososphaerales archaeon]|jgi:peptidoglycan/LPS O-acetylase OafA/YrhL